MRLSSAKKTPAVAATARLPTPTNVPRSRKSRPACELVRHHSWNGAAGVQGEISIPSRCQKMSARAIAEPAVAAITAAVPRAVTR